MSRTPLTAFSRPRASGIIAVDLHENDKLVGVALTDGEREVVLVTSGGKAIRFAEDEVRAMRRDAAGVRGITAAGHQRAASAAAIHGKEIPRISCRRRHRPQRCTIHHSRPKRKKDSIPKPSAVM